MKDIKTLAEKEVMNFRVPADFRYRIRRLAVEKRMTLSDLVIAAVDAFGAEEFKPPPVAAPPVRKPRRRNRASRIVLRRVAGSDGAEEPISPDELAAREAKRKAEKAAQRRLQREHEAEGGTVRRGRQELEVS